MTRWGKWGLGMLAAVILIALAVLWADNYDRRGPYTLHQGERGVYLLDQRTGCVRHLASWLRPPEFLPVPGSGEGRALTGSAVQHGC